MWVSYLRLAVLYELTERGWDLPMLYSQGSGFYSRALRKWLLMLTDELEGMIGRNEIRKSIKKGELREALDELRRVLTMANMDDLADKTVEIMRKVDELTGRIMVREGLYYQAMYLESVRHDIKDLIVEIRRRTRSA